MRDLNLRPPARKQDDEFLAAMTAWGTVVGVVTGALARSDARGKNALWGLMAGALVTGAVALAAGCDYQCGTSAALVGLGAGMGSGIGALVPPRRSSWNTVGLSPDKGLLNSRHCPSLGSACYWPSAQQLSGFAADMLSACDALLYSTLQVPGITFFKRALNNPIDELTL